MAKGTRPDLRQHPLSSAGSTRRDTPGQGAMTHGEIHCRVLVVDDEEEFRSSTRRTLQRRGFDVVEAATGELALEEIRRARPDVVLLDLRMPGMGGIETLRAIRDSAGDLPVIVLTGHGSVRDALVGIHLEIVDFLPKPVPIDRLAVRIREMVQRGATSQPLREPTIAELMVSPDLYPRLWSDQSVEEVFSTLGRLFERSDPQELAADGIRSAVVFDHAGRFLGMVGFTDLLRLLVPPSLVEVPYATFFTGMLLAQCRVVAPHRFAEVLGPRVVVELGTPIMEAVHLMTAHRLTCLPVLDNNRLVGVLRDRDVIEAIARSITRRS